MEWENYHLYEFQVGRDHYSEAGTGIPGIKAAGKVLLSDVLVSRGSKLLYIYDFGDEWHHNVRLERLWEATEDEPHTYCLAGARAGPPEDVGGSYGYMEWLDMLASEDDGERSEAEEVLGDDYDAERFDLEAVNRRINSVSSRWRSRMPRT
jgi:hypothetical protein